MPKKRKTSKPRTIEDAIATHKAALKDLDDETVGVVIGVAQALDGMQKTLKAIDRLLDKREFERASNLGYEPLPSEFVFLQRVLADLHGLALKKEHIITEVAIATEKTYDEVAPSVLAKLESLKPRKPLTAAERKANREWAKKTTDEMLEGITIRRAGKASRNKRPSQPARKRSSRTKARP